MAYEIDVDREFIAERIEETVAHAIDQAMSQRLPVYYETQVTQIEAHTDPRLVALPPADSMRSKVHRFIEERRRESGQTPTTKQIMQHCGCAESTARQYRREMEK